VITCPQNPAESVDESHLIFARLLPPSITFLAFTTIASAATMERAHSHTIFDDSQTATLTITG
jgi:hypothetical protein